MPQNSTTDVPQNIPQREILPQNNFLFVVTFLFFVIFVVTKYTKMLQYYHKNLPKKCADFVGTFVVFFR